MKCKYSCILDFSFQYFVRFPRFTFLLLLLSTVAYSQAPIIDVGDLEIGGNRYNDVVLRSVIDDQAGGTAILFLSSGDWNITSDLLIPRNITLKIPRGVRLNLDDGVILNFGGTLDAGIYHIFSFGTGGQNGIREGEGKVIWQGENPSSSVTPPVLYPEWWGAIGNDEFDDYPAIQRCLNVPSVINRGVTVFFQPGAQYVVSDGLLAGPPSSEQKDNSTISLKGNGCEILLISCEVDKPLLQLGSYPNSKYWNTTVEGFTFNFDKDRCSPKVFADTTGIKISYGDRIQIKNCIVKRFLYGIESREVVDAVQDDFIDNKYLVIENVVFQSNVIGCYLREANVLRIADCNFLTNYRAVDISGVNMVIENNDISANGAFYLFRNTIYRGHSNLPAELRGVDPETLVRKRTAYELFAEEFQNLTGITDSFNSIIKVTNSSDIQFSNYFEGNGAEILGDSACLINFSDCNRFRVFNNRFSGGAPIWSSATSLRTALLFQDCEGGEVTKNVFNNFDQAAITFGGQSNDVEIRGDNKYVIADEVDDGALSVLNKELNRGLNLEQLGALLPLLTKYRDNYVGSLDNVIPELGQTLEGAPAWSFTDVTELTNEMIIGPDGVTEVARYQFEPNEGVDNSVPSIATRALRALSFSEGDSILVRFWARLNGFIDNSSSSIQNQPILQVLFTPDVSTPTVKGIKDISLSHDWRFFELVFTPGDLDRLEDQNSELKIKFRSNSYEGMDISFWGFQVLKGKIEEGNHYYPNYLSEEIDVNGSLQEGPLTITDGPRVHRLLYSDHSPNSVDFDPFGHDGRTNWGIGDICINADPQESENVGWIFTADGWLSFGIINADPNVGYNCGQPLSLGWRQIRSGTTVDLNDIAFVNDCRGFIVGDDETLLQTENGGKSWIQMAFDFLGADLVAIEFYDESIGLIGTSTGSLYRTTTAGETWELLQSPSSTLSEIVDIDFGSAGEPLVINAEGKLFQMDLGSEIWEEIMIPNYGPTQPFRLHALIPLPENSVMLIGNRTNGRARITIYEGGSLNNPERRRTSDKPEVMLDETMYNSLGGFLLAQKRVYQIVGNRTELVRNTDSNFRTEVKTQFCFRSSLEGIATTASGRVLETRDGGKTWESLSIPTSKIITEILYHEESRSYICVGEGGTIVVQQLR